MPPLVSVVVPAFNAERTLAETLASAADQTHRELEILVVDDGSTDATADLVRAFAARDGRVRLIPKANGGVAAARNAGISEARGAYVAPLDADDLWHPRKIELQVGALEAAGPGFGLAYNWYRRVNERGEVTHPSANPVVEGVVLHRHLAWNFVSNGSTPLMRKSALAGLGYDPALQRAGNQGCEDYLLQLRLAMRTRFVCVPAFLTGYRKAAGAMSSQVARMIRSHIQMYEILLPELPASAHGIVRRELARLHIELVRNRARRGEWRDAGAALRRAFAESPSGARRSLVREAAATVGAARRTLGAGTGDRRPCPFASFAQDEPDGAWVGRRSRRALDELEALDRAYALRTV
ncbi:MAG: glycosyltransferase family 2 protein [Alphaproteobacteria bacterium]|nr:glycosyltransferase family 2 protein [Alphaproteobacteria bacterium]